MVVAKWEKNLLYNTHLWALFSFLKFHRIGPNDMIVVLEVFSLGHLTLHLAVSVGTSVCRYVGTSVRYEFCWIPSGYCITAPAQLSATVLPCIRPCWAHYSCPNAQVTFSITAPAHPHAPGIIVYLTLSYNHTFRYNIKFEITENLRNENKT